MVTVPYIMVRLERMLDYRGVGLGGCWIMECLLPYLCMVTVPHIMVRLERMLDYRGVGLGGCWIMECLLPYLCMVTVSHIMVPNMHCLLPVGSNCCTL